MSPEEVLQRHLLMIDSQQQQQQVPITPSPSGRGGGGETSSVGEGTPASHLEDGTRSKEKRKLSVREIVSTLGRGEYCFLEVY
jgi:hypothetical protein